MQWMAACHSEKIPHSGNEKRLQSDRCNGIRRSWWNADVLSISLHCSSVFFRLHACLHHLPTIDIFRERKQALWNMQFNYFILNIFLLALGANTVSAVYYCSNSGVRFPPQRLFVPPSPRSSGFSTLSSADHPTFIKVITQYPLTHAFHPHRTKILIAAANAPVEASTSIAPDHTYVQPNHFPSFVFSILLCFSERETHPTDVLLRWSGGEHTKEICSVN